MMESSWWMSRSKWVLPLGMMFLLVSCGEEVKKELPVLGPYKVVDEVVDGALVTDTMFTTVRPFSFTDQDSNEINHATVEGKVFVTDFFFTSCPTICPKMKQQMLRVYDAFDGESQLVLLSHSIDPIRDSVGRLKDYADKLGIQSDRWHMVTGNRDSIYSMAKHYMIAAQVDELAPGGYAHSGAFLLIDRNKQIRGIYDGTSEEEVDVLMEDIEWLLHE